MLLFVSLLFFGLASGQFGLDQDDLDEVVNLEDLLLLTRLKAIFDNDVAGSCVQGA